MRRNGETAFCLVAIAAAVLYGFMHAGQFGLSFLSSETDFRTLGPLLYAVMQTYPWLPSFVAGVIVARRAVLLGVVIILLGKVFASVFRDLFAPTIFIDDWDPPVVNWVQLGLTIAEAAVAAMGGQVLANRGSSNKTIEPTR